ncbi:hypothetical protein AADZ86_15965 [Colwelliaceae bacterium BS250]
MYALVDAVSFYASAEKVYDPSIRNRPVIEGVVTRSIRLHQQAPELISCMR